MGKIGITLAEKTAKYVKALGKKSILQTLPQKPILNIKGLTYAPELKSDTFVRRVETWRDPLNHVTPYAELGKTEVPGHHGFNGSNSFSNRNLEDEIMMMKERNPNMTPEHLKKCIEGRKQSIADTHILDINCNRDFLRLTPQPHASTAYRGTSQRISKKRMGSEIDIIEKAKIGDEIVTSGGFNYAAHHKFGAYPYMNSPYDYLGNVEFKPMLIEYKIPKGAQVSVNMEHGGEVVFPALSKYKLLSKETRYIQSLDSLTGVPTGSYPYRHVVLEYIPEIPVFAKDIVKLTDAEYELLLLKAKECKTFAEFANLPKLLDI